MATLEVLGMGCRRCIGLLQNAEEAVRQEGRNDLVTKVTDYDRISRSIPGRFRRSPSTARWW